MPKRTAYNDLTLLPSVIAETVCGLPYTGQEWSLAPSTDIQKYEKLREKMTPEQIHEFCSLADRKCRLAYSIKSKWFEAIVKARGNRGRDQLYIFITHWMTSYLNNPNILRYGVESTEIRQSYKDGKCPDCGTLIPIRVRDGQACVKCEHVFCIPKENDA